MCVEGSLALADALKRVTSHPGLCGAAWEVCLAFGEVVEDMLVWGEEGPSSRLAGEGGGGIRSCPPGMGVTNSLSSSLILSRPGSSMVLLLV